MINWSNGMPTSSDIVDVGREQIIELFTRGLDTTYLIFWLEGIEGEGTLERLAHGKLERWEFRDGKLNGRYMRGGIGQGCIEMCTFKDGVKSGEYRQWPNLRGRGEHSFYKNDKRVGEYKTFDEEMRKSKLLKHYYAMDTVSVDVSLAKKDNLPGPWLKDAKYIKRPIMKSSIL